MFGADGQNHDSSGAGSSNDDRRMGRSQNVDITSDSQSASGTVNEASGDVTGNLDTRTDPRSANALSVNTMLPVISNLAGNSTLGVQASIPETNQATAGSRSIDQRSISPMESQIRDTYNRSGGQEGLRPTLVQESLSRSPTETQPSQPSEPLRPDSTQAVDNDGPGSGPQNSPNNNTPQANGNNNNDQRGEWRRHFFFGRSQGDGEGFVGPDFVLFFIGRNSYDDSFDKASVRAIRNLKRIPLSTIPVEDQVCTICYDPFVEIADLNADPSADGGLTDHSAVLMPCGHMFGLSCLRSWLNSAKSCPMCRANVESRGEYDIEQRRNETAGTRTTNSSSSSPPLEPGVDTQRNTSGRGIFNFIPDILEWRGHTRVHAQQRQEMLAAAERARAAFRRSANEIVRNNNASGPAGPASSTGSTVSTEASTDAGNRTGTEQNTGPAGEPSGLGEMNQSRTPPIQSPTLEYLSQISLPFQTRLSAANSHASSATPPIPNLDSEPISPSSRSNDAEMHDASNLFHGASTTGSSETENLAGPGIHIHTNHSTSTAQNSTQPEANQGTSRTPLATDLSQISEVFHNILSTVAPSSVTPTGDGGGQNENTHATVTALLTAIDSIHSRQPQAQETDNAEPASTPIGNIMSSAESIVRSIHSTILNRASAPTTGAESGVDPAEPSWQQAHEFVRSITERFEDLERIRSQAQPADTWGQYVPGEDSQWGFRVVDLGHVHTHVTTSEATSVSASGPASSTAAEAGGTGLPSNANTRTQVETHTASEPRDRPSRQNSPATEPVRRGAPNQRSQNRRHPYQRE